MTNDFHNKMTFTTGAQRSDDTGKSRIDLISPVFLGRLGHHLGIACTPIDKGGKGYGERNWEIGVPVSRYVGGIYRHLRAIQEGETDEDHEAALGFAIMGLVHTREMIRRGQLPPELDDLPNYTFQRPTPERLQELQEEAVMTFIPNSLEPLRIFVAAPLTEGNTLKINGPEVKTNRQIAIMVAQRLASRGHIPYVPHAATQPFDAEFSENPEWYERHSFSIIDRWANALFFIKPKTDKSMSCRERSRAEKGGCSIFTRLADVPILVPPSDVALGSSE